MITIKGSNKTIIIILTGAPQSCTLPSPFEPNLVEHTRERTRMTEYSRYVWTHLFSVYVVVALLHCPRRMITSLVSWPFSGYHRRPSFCLSLQWPMGWGVWWHFMLQQRRRGRSPGNDRIALEDEVGHEIIYCRKTTLFNIMFGLARH